MATSPATANTVAHDDLGPLSPDEIKALALPAFQAWCAGTSLARQRKLAAADLKPLFERACALCDQGQFEKALPLARTLQLFEPGWLHAFVLATCLQHTGKQAEAGLCWAAALGGCPDRAAIGLHVAAWLQETGDRRGAQALCADVARLSQDDAGRAALHAEAAARALALHR